MKANEKHEWLMPSEALDRKIPFEAIPFTDTFSEESNARYGFHIDQYGLLIEEELVSEVISADQIFSIPKSPHWLIGLINLRGNIVPIFNLKTILELDGEKYTKTNILVLGSGKDVAGFLIDGLPHSVPVTSTGNETVELNSKFKKFIQPEFKSENVIWFEFDYKALLKSLVNGDL